MNQTLVSAVLRVVSGFRILALLFVIYLCSETTIAGHMLSALLMLGYILTLVSVGEKLIKPKWLWFEAILLAGIGTFMLSGIHGNYLLLLDNIVQLVVIFVTSICLIIGSVDIPVQQVVAQSTAVETENTEFV